MRIIFLFLFITTISGLFGQIEINNLGGYWISKNDSNVTVIFYVKLSDKSFGEKNCSDSTTVLNGSFHLKNDKSKVGYFTICNGNNNIFLYYDAYGNGPFSYRIIKLISNDLIIEFDEKTYFFYRIKKREWKKELKNNSHPVKVFSEEPNVIDY